MLRTVRGVLLLGVLLGLPGGMGCATAPDARPQRLATTRQLEHPDDPPLQAAGEEAADREALSNQGHEWGVEPLSLRLSAAGYMLDFRYRIIDPEKASPFMDRAVKPCLVHQATGARMFVPNPPKVGSLRQTSRAPRTDRTYFMVFANPARFIKVGDRVTLALGDCKLENLMVE